MKLEKRIALILICLLNIFVITGCSSTSDSGEIINIGNGGSYSGVQVPDYESDYYEDQPSQDEIDRINEEGQRIADELNQ